MLQVHVNVCETVQQLQDFFSEMAESWKKLKTSNVFSSFIVCSNRNRSGPEVIKLEFILKLKIKCNDWLLADT